VVIRRHEKVEKFIMPCEDQIYQHVSLQAPQKADKFRHLQRPRDTHILGGRDFMHTSSCKHHCEPDDQSDLLFHVQLKLLEISLMFSI